MNVACKDGFSKEVKYGTTFLHFYFPSQSFPALPAPWMIYWYVYSFPSLQILDFPRIELLRVQVFLQINSQFFP